MLELPLAMRELLVEQLDEYFEYLDDTSDRTVISEAVVEIVVSVGEEISAVHSESILSELEESGEMVDESLMEGLEKSFIADNLTDYNGEVVVNAIERLCEIEWLGGDEDDDAAGFFGGDNAEDPYDDDD